jgi:hypothetical protein
MSESKNEHYGPEFNDGKTIFVFGSNLAGRHGAGAALDAVRHWGAVNGAGIGGRGFSYAIPTKGYNLEVLPLSMIARHVKDFIRTAKLYPSARFLVTRIGCGLAGYTDADIAPMFNGAPDNCVLPDGWRAYAG